MRMNERMPNVCERYLFYSLLISLFSCYYLEEKKKLKHFQMLDDMASFISLSIQKCTEKPEIDAKLCIFSYVFMYKHLKRKHSVFCQMRIKTGFFGSVSLWVNENKR